MNWQYLFFSFKGRISRDQFWLGGLVLLALYATIIVLLELFHDTKVEPTIFIFAVLFGAIIGFALLFPALAIFTKRWHDRGKSGLWNLILLIPVLGIIYLIIECGCFSGSHNDNRYGRAIDL